MRVTFFTALKIQDKSKSRKEECVSSGRGIQPIMAESRCSRRQAAGLIASAVRRKKEMNVGARLPLSVSLWDDRMTSFPVR